MRQKPSDKASDKPLCPEPIGATAFHRTQITNPQVRPTDNPTAPTDSPSQRRPPPLLRRGAALPDVRWNPENGERLTTRDALAREGRPTVTARLVCIGGRERGRRRAKVQLPSGAFVVCDLEQLSPMGDIRRKVPHAS